ncbi:MULTISPECIES: hypothetical protein [Streptococcus]|uniref:Uncharacterized protein n=1 Tax=Streptococcus mitis TaxID=28037 RepID=A0A428H3E4_STRMT|nr:MULTISPECIES: hypothetical protein [Streptococcus]RSJ90307.1 hypothetical protein D8789_05675 [Streptococcus mitis]
MSFGLLKDFLETTEEERVEVLYRYLVKGETGSYIAEDFYSNKNYAWKISAITQGYCEKGGKNRGKISVTKSEIKSFVESYPTGTYDTGLTISDWLEQSKTQKIKQSVPHLTGTLGDVINTMNNIIYTPQRTNEGNDRILNYIYSQGLGFASEYKYSIVLDGDLDKKISEVDGLLATSREHIYYVAVFDDYLVYILGALNRMSTDLLIPFKEIEKFVPKEEESVPKFDLLYKGKTEFGNNYRVTLPFVNYKNENIEKLYIILTLQYENWRLNGQRNYSSQLPKIRKQMGANATNFIGVILYRYLHDGLSIDSIVKEIFSKDQWRNGLKAIAKLLFFDYRLRVSDKGKLKEKTLSPVDFERFVEHFYNGIRVDKEEMAGGIPEQNGLYVLKSFFKDR